MPTANGKITAPVSIQDVRTTLGVSSSDVGTLCKHPNINMWAKWKPVDYVKIGVDDTINKATGVWNGTKEALTRKEWRFGGGGSHGLRVYTVPVISEYTDIVTETGEQDNTLKWVYNRPTGGSYSPYRLTDFAGYYHAARKPWYSAISSTLEINGSFFASIAPNYMPYDAELGEIDPNEIAQFLDFTQIYAGIIIENITKRTYWGITKDIAWDADNTDSYSFYFSIYASSTTTSSQYYLKYNGTTDVLPVSRNDTVKVYLLLCYSPNVNPMVEGNRFSALFTDTDTVFRRLVVGAKIRTFTISYTCVSLSVEYTAYSTTYYYRKNDSIYKARGVITKVGGTVKTTAGSSESNYTSFNLSLYATTTGTRTDGTTFTVEEIPSTSLYSENGGTFGVAKTIDLDYLSMPSYFAYRTLSDAENETNPIIVSGIPVPREIVYNNDDADKEGPLVKSGKVTLNLSAAARGQFDIIKFELTTGSSNVIKY